MKTSFEIDGWDDLEKMIKEMEKLPQKCVTNSAKDGAKIALGAAKQKAPKGETGNLKEGIILKGEKKKVNGKKVYGIMMDPKMNDVFVKESNGKRYYYPASQEFGFITRNGKKTPGKHFLRDSLIDNKEQIENKVVERLAREIDKVMG